MLTALKAHQQGKVKDTFGWLDTVPSPEGHKHSGHQNGVNGTHDEKTVDQLP